MQCSICERDASHVCCAACARHTAWPIRYNTLICTSETTALEEQISQYLGASTEGGQVRSDPVRHREKAHFEIQTRSCEHSIAEITEETKKIQRDIEGSMFHPVYHLLRTESHHVSACPWANLCIVKEKISALRQQNLKRRLQFEEVSSGLEEKRAIMLDSISRETRRTKQKWNALQNRTAEARTYLCKEAASLYGLKMKRRKKGTVEYIIGNVQIPDLQELGSHPPLLTSTSFMHLSHLLMLVSHYLSLKLPYEITPPARDRPLPSVKGSHNIRPRPLHLPMPLAELSRDDTAQYSLFLEGAAMLAYNIAWVCYTQGLEIADTEEAMRPGWNIWRLLVAGAGGVENGKFGRWSHGSAGAFLMGRDGSNMLREWHISFGQIFERLHVLMLGENLGLEWDLVEEVGEEFGDGGNGGDSGAEKRISAAGAGGWTKVRARER